MMYHHQANSHRASIGAQAETDTVEVEVAVGEIVSVTLQLDPDIARYLASDLLESAEAIDGGTS